MERICVVLGDYIERLDAVVSNLKPHHFTGAQMKFIIGFRSLLASALKYAGGKIYEEASQSASPSSLKPASGGVHNQIKTTVGASSQKAGRLQLKANVIAAMSPSLFRWADGTIGGVICEAVSAALAKSVEMALVAESSAAITPALHLSAQTDAFENITAIAMRGAILKAVSGKIDCTMDVGPAPGTLENHADAAIEVIINVSKSSPEVDLFASALLDLLGTAKGRGELHLSSSVEDVYHILLELNGVCVKMTDADTTFSTIGITVTDTIVMFRRVYELDDLTFGEIDSLTLEQLDYTEH